MNRLLLEKSLMFVDLPYTENSSYQRLMRDVEKLLYPESTPRLLLNRWRFRQQREIHRSLIESWLKVSNQTSLARALAQRPTMLGVVVWPYINAEWELEQRLQAIENHYRALTGVRSRLDLETDASVEVLDMSAHSPGLRLVLDRPSWFMREGELVLNLFRAEQRLMSLAFSINLHEGRLIALVGGLQGAKGENSLNIYHSITKDLEGLRPRAVLLTAFQMLCSSAGLDEIYCIADDHRHHRHSYFAKDKFQELHLDYNEVWKEQKGQPAGNGFFLLPLQPVRKSLEEIISKKRSMYRRRFKMMDQVSQSIEYFFNETCATVRIA
ncbi:MAG: DUF535 family protein [Acidobacteriota bacterium]